MFAAFNKGIWCTVVKDDVFVEAAHTAEGEADATGQVERFRLFSGDNHGATRTTGPGLTSSAEELPRSMHLLAMLRFSVMFIFSLITLTIDRKSVV